MSTARQTTVHPTTNGASIIAAIARVNYAATAEQVEQLAHVVVNGDHADTCYFRVLLAHMQSRLGRVRRGKQPPQEPVLDTINAELYPAALRGVGPPEMDQTERNRLGVKFRTAASTIRRFLRDGGDVRGIEVATATKNGMTKLLQPESAAPKEGTRAERGFISAAEALKKRAMTLARGDPEGAIQRVEVLMDELQKLLDDLGSEVETAHQQPQADVGGQTTTIVAGRAGVGRGTGAPAPMLHRGA